jgi:hypothetical protein
LINEPPRAQHVRRNVHATQKEEEEKKKRKTLLLSFPRHPATTLRCNRTSIVNITQHTHTGWREKK